MIRERTLYTLRTDIQNGLFGKCSRAVLISSLFHFGIIKEHFLSITRELLEKSFSSCAEQSTRLMKIHCIVQEHAADAIIMRQTAFEN